MSSQPSQRVYFPGLNALRFYAALSVVFTHIDEAEQITGLTDFDHIFAPLRHLFIPGHHAVTLFFVLSGFLITYLLLVEHQRQGEISVGKFYLRRILRIWPLYYLIVFLGFVVFPLLWGDNNRLHIRGYVFNFDDADYWLKLGLAVFMLPNLAFHIFPARTPFDHLWSIGVEEQFYLMWPLLVSRFIRRIFWLLFGVIAARILMTWVVWQLFEPYGLRIDNPYIVLWRFANFWRLEAMAIGGIAAVLVFRRHALLSLLCSAPVKYAVGVLMLVHIVGYDNEAIWFEWALSILYVLLILNVSVNPKPLFRLEHPVFTWLGNISYGVYMYSFLVQHAVFNAFRDARFSTSSSLFYNLTIYIFIVGGSLLVATVSYVTYERVFLRLKDRFAVVRSGSTPPAPAAETLPAVSADPPSVPAYTNGDDAPGELPLAPAVSADPPPLSTPDPQPSNG